MELVNSFKVSEVISLAWSKVKGSKGTFWGIIFSAIVITFVLNMIATSLGHGFISVLIRLLNVVIQFFLGLGLTYLAINRAMDKPINIGMVQDVCTVNILINMICYGLIIIIATSFFGIFAVIPLMMGMAASGGIMQLIGVLWVTVCVLAYIYLIIRLYLVKGYILYNKLEVIDAIKTSVRLTKGNEFNLFCLVLFNFVVYFLSAMLLMIGLIWSIPFILLTYGVVYRVLTQGQPTIAIEQTVVV